VYGKLFNLDSVLIRFPNIVRTTTYVCSTALYVVSIVVLFIMPRAQPELDRQWLDQIFFVVCTFYTTFFMFFFSTVLLLLLRLLKQLVYLNEETGVRNAFNMAQIENTITTLRYVLFAEIVCIPFAIGLFFGLSASEVARSNIWLYLNILAIIGYFAGLIAFWALVIRLAGPSARNSVRLKSQELGAPELSEFTSEDSSSEEEGPEP
jgi:phage shock protein PspC (stress-responsive transcriptional regulator)